MRLPALPPHPPHLRLLNRFCSASPSLLPSFHDDGRSDSKLYHPPKPTPSEKTCVETRHEREPISQIRKLISAFGPHAIPTPEKVIGFLLEHQHTPQAALRYFKWSQIRGGFLGVEPLCILLHILVHSGRLSSARELLKRSLLISHPSPSPTAVVDGLIECSQKCVVDLRSFNYVLTCYSRAFRVDNAIEAFCQMVERGIVPSIRSRNDLLAALVRSNSIEGAQELFREMQDRGMELDCCSVSMQ